MVEFATIMHCYSIISFGKWYFTLPNNETNNDITVSISPIYFCKSAEGKKIYMYTFQCNGDVF